MLIKRPEDIKPSEITDQSVYKSRRRFLATAVAAAGMSIGGGLFYRGGDVHAQTAAGKKLAAYKGLPLGPFSTDEDLSDYDDVTSYNNFYELGTRKEDPARNAHQLKTSPWTIEVSGECDKPGTYHLEDILDK